MITLTATPVVDFDVPPGVRLAITSSTSVQDFTLWRTHADGTVHRVLTETGQRIVGGAAIVTDYCAPYNQDLTYRVTADETATADAWMECQSTWLIHPAVPALSMQTKAVRSISSKSRASRSAEFQPQGSDPVFRSDEKRTGIAGTIVVRIAVEQEAALDALIDDDSVILINTPGDPGWDLTWLWARVDVEITNPTGYLGVHDRNVSLAYKKAADPDVDQTPVWTCDIAEATWAAEGVTTATAAAALYSTALKMQIDERI